MPDGCPAGASPTPVSRPTAPLSLALVTFPGHLSFASQHHWEARSAPGSGPQTECGAGWGAVLSGTLGGTPSLILGPTQLWNTGGGIFRSLGTYRLMFYLVIKAAFTG